MRKAQRKNISENMPQLDRVTYLSQFVWLCIFFFTYHLSVRYGYLPSLCRSVLVPKHLVQAKRIEDRNTNHNSGQVESLTRDSLKMYLESVSATSSSDASKIISNTTELFEDYLNTVCFSNVNSSLDKFHLAPVNRFYLTSFCEVVEDSATDTEEFNAGESQILG